MWSQIIIYVKNNLAFRDESPWMTRWSIAGDAGVSPCETQTEQNQSQTWA